MKKTYALPVITVTMHAPCTLYVRTTTPFYQYMQFSTIILFSHVQPCDPLRADVIIYCNDRCRGQYYNLFIGAARRG